MFNFGTFKKKTKKPTPFNALTNNALTKKGAGNNNESHLPSDVRLIARHDIFSNDQQSAQQKVLLVKAGTAVDTVMLEKLIRYGVKPDQFYIQKQSELSPPPVKTNTPDQALPRHSAMTNPISNPISNQKTLSQKQLPAAETELNVLEAMAGQSVHRNKIVVVDIDESSLKRSVNQLTAAGVSFSDVQPVKLRESLQWALTKYEPSMLIVDEKTFPATSLMAQINAIANQYQLEQLVLLVNPASHNEKTLQKLEKQCDLANIALVQKPLNHFKLSGLLESYKAKKQIQKQIMFADTKDNKTFTR